MTEKLNTVYEMEDINGEPLKMTLTYRNLLQLKRKHPDVYADYNKVATAGAKDEFDNITILYTGYLCQRIAETGGIGDALSFDDFLDILPVDHADVTIAAAMLISPKKTMASGVLS